MASIIIGDREAHIPPFKLRELRAAAPYIDRVLAQRRALSALDGESSEETAGRLMQDSEGVMESLTATLVDTLSVIAVGVLSGRGQRPYTPQSIAVVADEIEGELAIGELSSLSPIFNDILREAGMMQNRPMMPRAETQVSPSAFRSTESSQSSSQQGAPEETGTE